MRLSTGVLALLAAFAHEAVAQRAERPDIRVGDAWHFAVYYAVPSTTPNRAWVVTAVGDGIIEGTENGEPLRLTRDLGVLDSPRQRNSASRLLAFPLEVGKSWRYRSDWLLKSKRSTGSSNVEVKVVAFEKVGVPAGTFDAFRLELSSTLEGTSPIGSRYDGMATSTYWYAPSARAIVKSVNHNPYLGASTVELVEARPAR